MFMYTCKQDVADLLPLSSLTAHVACVCVQVNDEGYTPLMEAAREGHEEMVALLLAQGKHKTLM